MNSTSKNHPQEFALVESMILVLSPTEKRRRNGALRTTKTSPTFSKTTFFVLCALSEPPHLLCMRRIYLRKWLSEAFTGIFGKNLIMYVWDLLFLNKWSEEIFFKVTYCRMPQHHPLQCQSHFFWHEGPSKS